MTIDPSGKPVPRSQLGEFLDGYEDECPYIPTPEELKAETARIRQGWSAAERLRRAGYPDGRLPPVEVTRAKEPKINE